MILMSIRKEFATQIFDGSKKVELRRRRPKVRPGDLLAIYCPMPQMELMGIATIREVAVHTPSSLWKVTREICGVSHEEYVTYFSGAKQAVGLFIDRPTLLKAPVSLSELRTEWGDFRPPQEFRYLSEDQQRFVLNHLPAGKRALTAA